MAGRIGVRGDGSGSRTANACLAVVHGAVPASWNADEPGAVRGTRHHIPKSRSLLNGRSLGVAARPTKEGRTRDGGGGRSDWRSSWSGNHEWLPTGGTGGEVAGAELHPMSLLPLPLAAVQLLAPEPRILHLPTLTVGGDHLMNRCDWAAPGIAAGAGLGASLDAGVATAARAHEAGEQLSWMGGGGRAGASVLVFANDGARLASEEDRR